MKHKPFLIILFTLATVLCMGVCAFAAEAEPAEARLSEPFTDLSYSENETALSFMIDHGYIAGYTDGTFRPGRSYTRLELAQLVTALCELDTVSGYQSSFYDCDVAGAEAIDAAVSNGLMTGRSIQSFDPYGTVLKAEMLGTLEKAAACLDLDGFYDHASGAYTDWATDYTICTADEAMQSAYQLAQALELRAEAEAKAAEVEATANAVTELTGDTGASEEMSSYDQMTASAEPAASAEPEAETPAIGGDDSASPEPTNSGASEEPMADTTATPGTASGETATAASAEPAEQANTPPAGVTTPASTAAPTTTQQGTPAAPQTDAAASAADSADESDELRNEVKSKYADIRDSILAFLRDLLGK